VLQIAPHILPCLTMAGASRDLFSVILPAECWTLSAVLNGAFSLTVQSILSKKASPLRISRESG